jgi:predicted TPR repeat methyltransferase
MHNSEYENIYTNELTHWWYVTLHSLILQIINKEFGDNKNISILDAGCGTGGFLSKLDDYSQKEGFDFSETAVDFCVKRGLTNCFVQDLNTWVPTRTYDVIVSSDVLYHKNITDDQLIFNCFYEALNPGGILILNLPAFEILKRNHDIVVETKKRYTRKDFRQLYSNSKFKRMQSLYRLPLLFFVVALQKFVERLQSSNSSDIGKVSHCLNRFLIGFLRMENKLLLAGVKLPVGTSVLGIFNK